MLIVPLALAQNLKFLDDAPMSHFTEEDMEMFLETASDALDNAADGAEVSWKNPASGNHGTIVPVRTNLDDGKRCRVFRLMNHAGGLSSNVNLKACRDDVAGWQVVPID